MYALDTMIIIEAGISVNRTIGANLVSV